MCYFLLSAQGVLLTSSVQAKMAVAQQTVRRRRHPMSVRRRRHTFTSCIYVTLSFSAQKCRREACDNDSPRGGPGTGSSIACYTVGWNIRPDRRCDIMTPPVHWCTDGHSTKNRALHKDREQNVSSAERAEAWTISSMLRIRDTKTEGLKVSPSPCQVKLIGYLYDAHYSRARQDGRGMTPARPQV